MTQRKYTRGVALGVLMVSLFSSGLVFAADQQKPQESAGENF